MFTIFSEETQVIQVGFPPVHIALIVENNAIQLQEQDPLQNSLNEMQFPAKYRMVKCRVNKSLYNLLIFCYFFSGRSIFLPLDRLFRRFFQTK